MCGESRMHGANRGKSPSRKVEAYLSVLNQAAGDRQILAKQLNISPHQLSYVTHSGEGEGLLFYGNVILPFVDRFPQDTELYRIMTTRLNESLPVSLPGAGKEAS